MRSFLAAVAHEERVTEIENFIDQIERHSFHDLVAEDRHHDRYDQKRQIRNRVGARPLTNPMTKNTARKPNQMTGKTHL